MHRRQVGRGNLFTEIDSRFLFGTRNGRDFSLRWCRRLGDQHRLAIKSLGLIPWQYFRVGRSRRIGCDMRKDGNVHAFRHFAYTIETCRSFVNRSGPPLAHKSAWVKQLAEDYASPPGPIGGSPAPPATRLLFADHLFGRWASSDSKRTTDTSEVTFGAPRRMSALSGRDGSREDRAAGGMACGTEFGEGALRWI